MFEINLILIIAMLFGLKVYWDYAQTQSAKRKCIIREAENRIRLTEAGIDPFTRQAFGQDHSHDYCNAYSPCPGCKVVQDKNLALNKAAWSRYKGEN